ncbi:L-2-hydroxyglutarate oxidase [Solicola gregarius]|uniref:L-2-hydroxyglutarate oxidase n=1 Tax=Solicola gregarius TaxID=2908642 RepID=A0AA46THK1_9ACTN|nr:L-2-hydroxyglutarate oxidase [Solicola gregarius]UYM04643.1 L-2-hydroxyglutarate oxidase [Solicola gregarius]
MKAAVVGGGIVGAAVARRILDVDSSAEVTLYEKEDALAAHQTGRNSGVVHAGLYYTPGSAKARLCRRGVAMLREFCSEHGIAYDECGKILVALDERQRSRLVDIEQRAKANGVPGVRTIGPDEIREREPNVRGVAGLLSPTTAITDFPAVTRALVADAAALGATIRLGARVVSLQRDAGRVVVGAESDGGAESDTYDVAVLCAGVHSDRVASLAGDTAEPQIVPFRGEYYLLRDDRRDLVRGLIYPVPDPRYPFLGVHLTPTVGGDVMVGPNAVMALAREGYAWRDVSLRDLAEIARSEAFRRFARTHWRTGVRELAGSLSRRRFVAAARAYVPSLRDTDVVPGPRGIRAQALDPDGSLVDDFRIHRRGSVVAIRNAPSPAATSCLAIAEQVVDEALGR